MSFVQQSKILLHSDFFTTALSCILAALSDKFLPESASSSGSIFTSLQIILTSLMRCGAFYLVMPNVNESPFFT